jgi:hypothetical protein
MRLKSYLFHPSRRATGVEQLPPEPNLSIHNDAMARRDNEPTASPGPSSRSESRAKVLSFLNLRPIDKLPPTTTRNGPRDPCWKG